MQYTSSVSAKSTWQSPDSCVSDQVELVRKQNHGKILSLDKVTGFQRKKYGSCFFDALCHYFLTRSCFTESCTKKYTKGAFLAEMSRYTLELVGPLTCTYSLNVSTKVNTLCSRLLLRCQRPLWHQMRRPRGYMYSAAGKHLPQVRVPRHCRNTLTTSCVFQNARGGDDRPSFTERYPAHILRAGLEDRDANIAFWLN